MLISTTVRKLICSAGVAVKAWRLIWTPTFVRRLIVLGGVLGLLLDVAFHWVSAIYDEPSGAVSLGDVLRQLLIDVNPATVPLWVTLLGITAHVFFLGGFLALVVLGVTAEQRPHG